MNENMLMYCIAGTLVLLIVFVIYANKKKKKKSQFVSGIVGYDPIDDLSPRRRPTIEVPEPIDTIKMPGKSGDRRQDDKTIPPGNSADHRQDDNQKENPKGKSAERRQNDKPEKEKNLAKKNKTKKDKTKVEETAIKQAETTIPAPTPVVERDPGRTPSGGRRT